MDPQHEKLRTVGDPRSPLRVLILEDSADDAELIIHELRRGGFEFVWERADDRRSFEERLTPEIDVVLSDFTLPGFSGLEALKHLHERGLDIPFILISGTIGEDLAVQAMQLGAADYLLKDRMARLGPAISQALEKKGIAHSLQEANLMARGAMDSLMSHVALLDSDGTVIMVNEAWTEFARANTPPGQSLVGVGANYLVTCDRARENGDDDAAMVGEGIRLVLSGQRQRFEHEYACHSPSERRWFVCRVTRFGTGKDLRIVTSHSTITDIKLAEEELKRELAERIRTEESLRQSQQRYSDLLHGMSLLAVMIDRDGAVTFCNDFALKLTGWTWEEVSGRNWHDTFRPPEVREEMKQQYARSVAEDYTNNRYQNEIITREGVRRTIAWSSTPLRNAAGDLVGYANIGEDITERVRAESMLRRSEAHTHALIEAIPQIAWTADQTGAVDYLSTQWHEYSGYDLEETSEPTWPNFIHPEDYPQANHAWVIAVQAGEKFEFEFRLKRFDGVYRWFLSRGVPLKDSEGNVVRYFGTFTDIDDQKRAEQRQRFLAELGARIRPINDPEALVMAATEAVGKYLDVIRCAFIEVDVHQNRVTINPGYHSDIPGVAGEYPFAAFGAEVLISLSHGETVSVNDTSTDPRTAKHYDGLYRAMKARAGLAVPLMKNGVLVAALCAATYDEPRAWTPEEASLLEVVVEQLWLALENVRLLKHEIALRHEIEQGAQQYARIVETTLEGVCVLDRNDRIMYVNDRFGELTGYLPEELLGGSPLELTAESHRPVVESNLLIRRQTGRCQYESLILRKDGSFGSVIASSTAVLDEAGQYDGSITMLTDITDYKRAETERDRLAERNRLLLDSSGEGIFGLDQEDRCTFANRACSEMLGYSPEELIGASMHNLIHHSHEDGSHYPAERCPKNLTCRTGIASSSDTEVFWRKDGASFPVEYTANPLRWEGALAGAVVTFSDITERKRSRQQLNSQIARLAAMSAIDSYIMNSVDLTLTLDFIVGQIATPLNADAVDALVHRELEDCLECMAAVGFRYLNVRGRTQRAGEGQAGRTMLERKTIHYIDLQSHIGDFTHTDLLSRENLTSYISVPLIAKARVVGVLEVFHANAFEPDEEWMDLLRALAGQCAIAIESASLFESLQKTNLELRVAYDATIEGWSRALDMRDYETEGHSQRVAAITMRLAKAIGISGEDLVHIRRGALLHDIGKMAIPDRILGKEGPLTGEEREVMQRHVQYAFDFLSPLPFLRKALDIPYCHHERWDGTGYPNGLKGRQIPLAARLFAIADVWDALRSNRPYRKAWSVEKTRAYIQSNAGSHFDPELVDLFLRIGEE